MRSVRSIVFVVFQSIPPLLQCTRAPRYELPPSTGGLPGEQAPAGDERRQPQHQSTAASNPIRCPRTRTTASHRLCTHHGTYRSSFIDQWNDGTLVPMGSQAAHISGSWRTGSSGFSQQAEMARDPHSARVCVAVTVYQQEIRHDSTSSSAAWRRYLSEG
jgi:hypothetical protein